MKSSKLMLKAFTLSCLAVVSATGCREGGTTVSSEDRNIPVRKLYPESIEVPRSFVADIQAIQFVEVKSKVGGFIKEIHVDEGQEVKKGDVLFKLDAIEYYEAVREAEAALRQAEAEYQMTAYDVDRISKLVEKEILADVRLKQAQAELAVAELEVEQAKVKMQRAQLDYNYTTITAPIDGYVDRIPYKVGSLVGTETLLTNISNVAEVFAYFKMNETEYLKFRRAIIRGEEDARADTVQLVLADGTLYEHPGIVETVEGDFERQTGSIAFRARFPNPEGLLKHGVSGKINMMTKMDDVYLIPQQATFEIQEFTYVYTINDENVAKVRSFEPLARFNGYYVAENFEPGTEIAYSGIQRLKDGMKIKPVEVSGTDSGETEDTAADEETDTNTEE